MTSARRFLFAVVEFCRELLLLHALALPSSRKAPPRPPKPRVVAALTSHPGRIRNAWISIECLLRQSSPPDRLILVLSEEEFPEQVLPWRIRNQLKRGLDLLWVSRNGRSFDKLLPLLKRFPEAAVITFDDDKFFPPDLVEKLIIAHKKEPGHVIGARGWIIAPEKKSSSVSYGENWRRARDGDCGHWLFLPGGNGTLYPPGCLDAGVLDYDRAFELCPTADDIWFWAHLQKQRTPMICLGLPPHRPIAAMSKSSALSTINEHQNSIQFRAVIDALGIRKFVEQQANACNQSS